MALAHTQHARGNTCPCSIQSNSIQTSRASRLGDQCPVGDAALLRPGDRARGPGPRPRCLAPRPTAVVVRRGAGAKIERTATAATATAHCPLPTAPATHQEPGARSTTT
jgi:hypothetical protein